MSDESSPQLSSPPPSDGQYVVVARRYRPQTFVDLIGQEHVSQALCNAVESDRVGHAYLFTGARGVGKTSAARILAKALNCVTGPTSTPCNACDVCLSVSVGEDIDVLEIDGASNRGIDEIRTLRENAGIRPSRARYKIYIIDEVHMLTREAFNALLKTLEEPPEHVKFIFCTTEANKIPITILSRCQRFDFVGIQTEAIARRLMQIVETEGVEADAEALQILARRAAGSMRDSQSLLEQLLAFCPGRITTEEVHAMLGTAGDERLAELAQRLFAHDVPAALAILDEAITAGVDPAQLLEQLFGYVRDCLVAAAGCPAELFQYAATSQHEEVAEMGKQLGVSTLLAVMQILDRTLTRIRQSTQVRILAELALVRIASLEELDEIGSLIAQLGQGATAAPGPRAISPARKNERPNVTTVRPEATSTVMNPSEQVAVEVVEPLSPPVTSDAPSIELTAETTEDVWRQLLDIAPDLLSNQARNFEQVALEGSELLVVTIAPQHVFSKTYLEGPEKTQQLETLLSGLVGRRMRIRFKVDEYQVQRQREKRAGQKAEVPMVTQSRLKAEVEKNEFVQKAIETFGAEVQNVVKRDEGQSS